MRAMRLAVVASALAAVGGFAPGAGHGGVDQNFPECPHSWSDTTVKEGSQIPNAGEWRTLNVPEINDCQRFIAPHTSDREYTSGYFAIFAYPDSIPVSRRIDGSDSVAVPVAFIFAESEGYEPLHILKGGNCVYLHLDNGSWKALIKPAVKEHDGSAGCDRRTSANSGAPLEVHAQSAPKLALGDYPNTSRWDWDSVAGQQYLGVRCDSAWCEIGSAHPSLPHPDLSLGATTTARRTVEVKGWYDEQYLAACDTTGNCHPTALIGTIFPDPRLDQLIGVPVGRFVPAARIAIRVDSSLPDARYSREELDFYWKKFHLQPTPKGSRLNRLELCNGGGPACHVPQSSTGKCPAYDATSGENYPDHGLFWYRVIPPRGDTLYGCYLRRTSMAPFGHIIGTARWRWLLKDETIWVRCLQGCCEAQ